MKDTQWPRFEVFVQEKEGKPHQGVGSVHAPDAEMALLNARDVFVRRPDCYNLWVVPEQAIFAKTAEELITWQSTEPTTETAESYLVFQKQTHRNVMISVNHVGVVQARCPEEAMNLAIHTFTTTQAYTWWVCPETAVSNTTPDDIASLFAPAHTKRYRQPNNYRTVTALRKAKEHKE